MYDHFGLVDEREPKDDERAELDAVAALQRSVADPRAADERAVRGAEVGDNEP